MKLNDEVDAALIDRFRTTPFDDRGLVLVGGRFMKTKSEYGYLKFCAACRRLGKAFKGMVKRS